MANTTGNLSESPFATPAVFPPLRSSRNGSITSLSTASRLDKEVRAQTLDQIHNSACNTETLTTFNEFTSPPSASCGNDGKGIASELHGGLSGLYNRFRASVGNVRDIVSQITEDGHIDNKSLRDSQISSSSLAPTNGQITDPYKALNPSTDLLRANQGTVAERPFFAENSGLDSGKYEKDQYNVSTSLANSSSPSTPIFSSTQVTTRAPNFSAVIDVNPKAIKEREFNGETSSTMMAAKSTTSSKTLLNLPAEAHIIKSSDKPYSQISFDNLKELDSGKIQKAQISWPILDDKTGAATWFSENSINNRIRNARKNGLAPDSKYAIPDSGLESIREPICSPEPTSGVNNNTVEASRIVSNPAFTQDDSLNGIMGGDAMSAAVTEQSQKQNHQDIEPTINKMLIPLQARLPHVPDSYRSPALPESAVTGPLNTSQQGSHNSDPGRDMDVVRATTTSQLKVQGIFPPNSETRTNNVFLQIKSKILNKEFWMRDENARDCFYCGDSFSTFRRKHHCRTCGQIFDAKCTSLLSGAQFGQSGSIRVCKPCEGIINGYDDSSDFSDDSNHPVSSSRPRHGSAGANDILASPARSNTPQTEDLRQSSKYPDISVPTMAIPATRRSGGDPSKKAVFEIDAERTLPRPSSSRSLKSSSLNRPHTAGHRRHNSRHLNQRGFKIVAEESAPFHRNLAEEKGKPSRLRAFHDDNIIDPDLAPFLSDEGSSGDEQVSIMSAINGEGARSYDNEKHGLSGLLSSKKGRFRAGEKSIIGATFASKDTDNNSLSSIRPVNNPRSSRRRNLSATSNLRPSPRTHRVATVLPPVGSSLHESGSPSTLFQMLSSSMNTGGSRMIRSSSMRGASAPAVELNHASLQHVRKLLRQLLQDSKVPSVAGWEKALVPILLRATDDVNPDVLNGDDMDIRHYVKLKKIPGGYPGDTSYVSGLVFTKNLALKSMPRSLLHPNILILTFPLEYARRQQHFMSLEPVIRQEREFLQNIVNRIAALHPQLLLVERNVSGLALEFLEQAGIATAYNVKPSVLEAVSRCTQTRIISSIDKLAIKPAHTGTCESFYLKTYLHGTKKKTYMFLSGCAQELGCTIVLRGAPQEMLVKLKRITEFMVYVVYNLKLETCLMRDEFALMPSLSPEISLSLESKSPTSMLAKATKSSQDALPDEIDPTFQDSNSGHDSVEASDTRSNTNEMEPSHMAMSHNTPVPEDVLMPTFYGDMVEQHKTKILSASPFVKFAQPYLLMRAREQERRLAYLKRLRDQDILEEQNQEDISKPEKFDLIKPEMIHEEIHGASRKVREFIHAVHDAEYDKALHNYKTHTKQWEAYIAGNINMFDPYAHQNIAILYSVVCTITTVPCSGPDLLALSFYNELEIDEEFIADCTLGQYVEDLCLGANTICTANGCDRKMFDHHRQYVHGEAQVSVFVEEYPCKLRGLQDTVLMWSCCKICNKETPVMAMSENSWKYSFAKYLELCFWSSNIVARAGICPHDLRRDHLRYFGFRDIAVRFHYDHIKLLEIVVPRARITWNVDHDLRFKNEVFCKIEERLNKYMASVKARIKSIKVESVIPEKAEVCKQQVDELFARAGNEHTVLVEKLQDTYMSSKFYEMIPLNQALRATQEKVAEWDVVFSEFDRNFFPSEKDIRRLATLQLKKIFLDRDDSTTSLNSTEGSTTSSIPGETGTEKSSLGDVRALAPQTRTISPEKAHDMLTSVVERHASDNGSSKANDVNHPKASSTIAILPVKADVDEALQRGIKANNSSRLDLAAPLTASKAVTSDDAFTSPSLDTKGTCIPKNAESKADENNQAETDDPKNQAQTHPPAFEKPVNRSHPPQEHVSGIPRLGNTISPPIYRSKSQPCQPKLENDPTQLVVQEYGDLSAQAGKVEENVTKPLLGTTRPVEKRLSDRLGLSVLKPTTSPTQSMIPRSITNRRKDSNVSNLAKHFEQLSREFEKERIRDRRQRAAKVRQARAFPMVASKPIVEVYRNVNEAVEEREPSDEELLPREGETPCEHQEESTEYDESTANFADSQAPTEDFHVDETTAETTETEGTTHVDSRVGSDTEGDGCRSEEEQCALDDIEVSGTAEEHHALLPAEAQLDMKLDLPKHEKSSLMKMLTNFWAERSASGWQPLDYPLNASDHIFADSDVIVREDEPSSLIAFALGSEDYQEKLRSISENSRNHNRTQESTINHSPTSDCNKQLEVERSLLRSTGTHLKYQFQEGSAKMLCKVFFAEQFDAVRRKCGVDERIVESLSRCLKWDSKGGKTKSVFLKTLDDRLVLKSLSTIETQAFLRFAPAYFRIMSEALFHELPSVIAKMLGFYQVIIKNPITGVDFNWFLLVMENLFYDRSPTRIFDLKGSMRNRRIKSTGEQNEVLLDENMVEFIYESPLFSREHSKKLLRASIWNDTLFLSGQNVMDYSLMMAIDEDRKELVIGIIDCIRTYTWDKKLETWIKDRGKNRPTVTSPREYKNRFREAMGRYVLQAPNCWHQFKAQQVELRPWRQDEQEDSKDREGDTAPKRTL